MYQHRPLPAPVDATWTDAQKEAERGGYRLITTKELAALYQQEPHSFLLVDTRQDWEFMSGYIQGALHFPHRAHQVGPLAGGKTFIGPFRTR